jgi:hypothetical protein
VPIDAAGVDKATAKLWKDGAEKMWNDAFNGSDNPYKGCLTLKLKIDVKAVARDALPRPHRHEIYGWERDPAEAEGGILDRDIDPYKAPRDGWFDPSFNDAGNANRVAHEVGHLMGLKDEYEVTSVHPRKTRPLDRRQNTLMADGGKIDSLLIDTLVKRLRHAADNVSDCPPKKQPCRDAPSSPGKTGGGKCR